MLLKAKMMNVTVRFIGSLRAASKKSKLTLRLEENVSLGKALGKIAEELPRLRRVLADSDLNPKTNLLMLVNEKEISVLAGLETVLHDGDEIVLVPIVHGG